MNNYAQNWIRLGSLGLGSLATPVDCGESEAELVSEQGLDGGTLGPADR